MGNTINQKEPSYDWEGIRRWCIAYLQLFVAAGESDTEESWRYYRLGLKALPLKWSRVRRISDERVQYIVEVITSVISEGCAPEGFAGLLKAAKVWLHALEESNDVNHIVTEVAKIDDSI